MNDGSCRFVPHAGFLLDASRSLFERPIGEGFPLAQRLSGKAWNIGSGELDLCLLLLRQIGGGPVGRKGIMEVLFVLLIDGSWKRGEGGEDMVAYGKSLLGRWCERNRQSDTVELGWTK